MFTGALLLSVFIYLLRSFQAKDVPDVNVCFKTYLDSTSNSSQVYAQSYSACIENQSKIRKIYNVAKAYDREEIEAGAQKICANFNSCNQINNDIDFFQCYVNVGYANINILLDIKLNSTAALVDLNDDYGDAEKQTILCTIEARRVHTQAASAAYNQLTSCLKD